MTVHMLYPDSTITRPPDTFHAISDALMAQTSGYAMQWSGRAATALYYAYRVAHLRHTSLDGTPEVIMPAMMCTTAANVAYLAGYQPRFADVDAQGLVTLEHIQARYTPQTIAVVVIHLYGATVDTAPIRAWCNAYNITLIEDMAQAVGAKLADGAWAGSHGHFAVYSFNRTKLLEDGGGALVANDTQTAHALQATQARYPLPAVPPLAHLQMLSASYRNLHHSLVALYRAGEVDRERVSSGFMQLRGAYDALYLRPADPASTLGASWHTLPASLTRRYERAEQYARTLAGGAWTLFDGWRASGVCWRFSLRVPAGTDLINFSEAVRRDGFHVSNLYWAENDFFKPEDACPESTAIAQTIVNLWVDDSVDAGYIARCCESLSRHSGLLMTS